VEKWVFLGGTMEELQPAAEGIKEEEKEKKPQKKTVQERIAEAEAKKNNKPKVKKIEKKEETAESSIKKKNIPEASTSVIPPKEEANPMASYDVIPLPSNGECYRHKKQKLPVAYLTAYDENMIIAPNLYNDNKILDHILKAKVLDETVDCGDLIEGDREAIILFLRASGYGNEYPITVKDNITGTEFDATIDLSKLKYKEFKLTGDENGWFDFTLPVSKKEIKFKFLTHNDLEYLERIEESEGYKTMKSRLASFVADMTAYVEHDSSLETQQKVNIRKAINTIDSWQDDIPEEDSIEYTHTVTNRLLLQVQSVDGVTDKGIIKDFVYNMNVKDAKALRTYISENEPGVDYSIEIEKPESLGGGSMTVFLQFDQYVFLNVA
jgi:hypothetical protein